MFKKIMSLVLTLTLMCGLAMPAFAATENEESAYDKLVYYLTMAEEQSGHAVSAEEITAKIEETAQIYCDKLNVTTEEAYELFLAEVEDAIDLAKPGEIMPIANGVTLPPSREGDIFFTDNNMPWNHVGMYTTSNTIVEATPTYNVHYGSINDYKTTQYPVGGILDNSCILRLKAGGIQVGYTILWLRDNVPEGTPYDDGYFVNKDLTDEENAAFDCSELVWKAYKCGCGIDLDSNGGQGVFPNDIRSSSVLSIINDTWGK